MRENQLIQDQLLALFSKLKLTTCSGKHQEDISHAHLVSLIFKLITSSKGSDDLSFGFDRDRVEGKEG